MDDDDIGNDNDIWMFIIGHRFRYSLLYSVLGFFVTTLLELHSESKSPTRWGLTREHGPAEGGENDDTKVSLVDVDVPVPSTVVECSCPSIPHLEFGK